MKRAQLARVLHANGQRDKFDDRQKHTGHMRLFRFRFSVLYFERRLPEYRILNAE